MIYKPSPTDYVCVSTPPISKSAARFPGKKKLAEEFGVARMTIRKVIDLLVTWGLVVRRHGSGTYVARKDLHHETSNLTGLAESCASRVKRWSAGYWFSR